MMALLHVTHTPYTEARDLVKQVSVDISASGPLAD